MLSTLSVLREACNISDISVGFEKSTDKKDQLFSGILTSAEEPFVS